MRDEEVSELFGMGVDVEIYLGEDGKPNVFWAEDEVVVGAVGLDGGPDEAVGGGGDVGLFEKGVWKRRLDDAFAGLGVFGT